MSDERMKRALSLILTLDASDSPEVNLMPKTREQLVRALGYDPNCPNCGTYKINPGEKCSHCNL